MLVNATGMLQAAQKGHYAVGAFNTNNLEWADAIIVAAQEAQSPLLIECSRGAAKWQTSFKMVADIVRNIVETRNVTVPVALHLDHGTYEACFEAIDAGFTSIMYDGSKEPDFETNMQRTQELVTLAHSKGISIEAEVGGIGENAGSTKGEIADPDECKKIADLGVDFLACGIGNIHGVYPEGWEGLDFDALAAIKAKTGDLPLVLHGGTGIPTDQIKKAINLGVCKINVNTDLQIAFCNEVRAYFEAGKDREPKGFDPRKIAKAGRAAITQRTKELMEEFGSTGRGWDF